MFQPGDIIGPYGLLRTLGRGAFGEVWLAERRSSLLTTQVALKLPLDAAADLDVNRNEAQVWLKASGHPNIVPVLDAEVYDGQVVIASEFVAGGSLKEWLDRNGGKAPSVEAAVRMMQGILAGLEHLHANELIHRDLKPDNVMLQNSTPRLTDFGLTRILKVSAHSTNLAGTPGYMAPEAFQGHYSAASDLWAAGMLLHELLVGALPYPEADFYVLLLAITSAAPVPIAADLPAAIRSLLAQALAKPPGERFASAAEMSGALTTAVAMGPLNVSPLPPKPANNLPNRTPLRHRWKLLRSLAVGLGVLVLGSGIYFVSRIAGGRAGDSNGRRVSGKPAYVPDAKAKALVIEGEHLSVLGDAANLEGIATLEKAIRIDSKYAEAHAALAAACFERTFFIRPDQVKWEIKAAVEVDAALSLEPDCAKAHYVKGRILWSQESHFRHEEAIQEFQKALRSDPNSSEAHGWLGLVYQHIGLFDNSRREIQRAIYLNTNAPPYVLLGSLDVYASRYPQALDDLRTLPDDSITDYDRAWAQFRLGQKQEAADTLKHSLAAGKGKDTGGVLHSMQAVLFASSGNKANALQAIREAKEAGQGFGHFHHAEYTIASAYALIGEKNEALETLRNAAARGFPCYPLFRDDPNLNSLRGYAPFKAFLKEQRQQFLGYEKRHPTPL